MKKTLLVLASLAVLASCKNDEKKGGQEDHKKDNKTELKEEKTMEVSNNDKAVAVLESLETGAKEPIGYINPNKYIQHNQSVGDGLAGFGEVMKHAPEGGFKAKVVRSFEDGDYVFTQTIYDFFGPKIGFDVFRFEDGKIVEHWDNLIAVSYTHLRAHETSLHLVCRLLLEKKK